MPAKTAAYVAPACSNVNSVGLILSDCWRSNTFPGGIARGTRLAWQTHGYTSIASTKWRCTRQQHHSNAPLHVFPTCPSEQGCSDAGGASAVFAPSQRCCLRRLWAQVYLSTLPRFSCMLDVHSQWQTLSDLAPPSHLMCSRCDCLVVGEHAGLHDPSPELAGQMLWAPAETRLWPQVPLLHSVTLPAWNTLSVAVLAQMRLESRGRCPMHDAAPLP